MLFLGFDCRYRQNNYLSKIKGEEDFYLTRLNCKSVISADIGVMPGPYLDLPDALREFPVEFDCSACLWTTYDVMKQYYSQYDTTCICLALVDGSPVQSMIQSCINNSGNLEQTTSLQERDLYDIVQKTRRNDFKLSNFVRRGVDVVDLSLLSGLLRFGIYKRQQEVRRKILEGYVNEYHLIDQDNVALKYSAWLSSEFPSHSSFFPVTIYEESPI